MKMEKNKEAFDVDNQMRQNLKKLNISTLDAVMFLSMSFLVLMKAITELAKESPVSALIPDKFKENILLSSLIVKPVQDVMFEAKETKS